MICFFSISTVLTASVVNVFTYYTGCTLYNGQDAWCRGILLPPGNKNIHTFHQAFIQAVILEKRKKHTLIFFNDNTIQFWGQILLNICPCLSGLQLHWSWFALLEKSCILWLDSGRETASQTMEKTWRWLDLETGMIWGNPASSKSRHSTQHCHLGVQHMNYTYLWHR